MVKKPLDHAVEKISRLLVISTVLVFLLFGILLLEEGQVPAGVRVATAQDWSYDDSLTNGPSSWGSLYDPRNPLVYAYPNCDTGSQSPVDIRGRSSGVVNVAVDGSAGVSSSAAAATTQSSGGNYATLNSALKELPLRWSGMTNMTLNVGGTSGGKVLRLLPAQGSSGAPFADPNTGKGYVFTHADIHTPAEHWIGGVRPDAEIQLYHEARITAAGQTSATAAAETYQTLVVSILLEAVSTFSTHEDIRRLLADLERTLQQDSSSSSSGNSFSAGSSPYNVTVSGGGMVALSSILPSSSDYYTYDGSLSYPPCTGGVKWYVLSESVKVSTGQLDLLRTAVGLQSLSSVEISQSSASTGSGGGTDSLVNMDGNSRPPQSLGTRPLWFFQSGQEGATATANSDHGNSCDGGEDDQVLICADQDRKGTSISALIFSIFAVIACVAALALRLSEHDPHNRR